MEGLQGGEEVSPFSECRLVRVLQSVSWRREKQGKKKLAQGDDSRSRVERSSCKFKRLLCGMEGGGQKGLRAQLWKVGRKRVNE